MRGGRKRKNKFSVQEQSETGRVYDSRSVGPIYEVVLLSVSDALPLTDKERDTEGERGLRENGRSRQDTCG